MTNPDAEQTGTSAQMLNEILNYFQTKEIDPGDGWAFPDDYSSLCLDFRGTDDTAFWLDLERNGTIRVVWRPNGAKLRSMTFVAASQDAREELEPYCQHLQICSSRDPLFNNPCDCGLEAALAAPQSAPALAAPQNTAERMPNRETALAGADAVALADEYEAGLRKMEASGYEEFANVIPKHRIIIAALRAQPSPGVLTGFDASQDTREALIEQCAKLVEGVGAAMFTEGEVKAVEAFREDAAFSIRALAAPQPQALNERQLVDIEIARAHEQDAEISAAEVKFFADLSAQPQAGASEPVAWIVLTKDGSMLRIWWRNKVPAEAWSAQHNLPLIPLYAAPLPAASILALATPSPTATESLANPSK